MTIVAREEPVGVRAIAHAMLARHAHLAEVLPSLRGERLQIAAPLPVFRLAIFGPSRIEPLERARIAGWRIPIVGGQSEALLDLLKTKDGPEFAGIAEGSIPHRLLVAAMTAEKELGQVVRKFEMRLLEVPLLRFHALWLHARGGPDFFVPLSHERETGDAMQGEAGIRLVMKHVLSDLARANPQLAGARRHRRSRVRRTEKSKAAKPRR